MAYTPFNAYPPQFQSSASVNLSGGRLEFYVAGTTTATNVYSDDTGTVIGSAVTLNASGYPESGGNVVTLFRDTDVDLKVILKDASLVEVWSSDNIDMPTADMFAIVNADGRYTATDIDGALNEAKGEFTVKTADESKASDTTLADDATLAGFTVESGAWYRFEALIDVAQNVGDFKFAFDFTIAPALFTGLWHAVDLAGVSDEDNVNFGSSTISITTMTDSSEYQLHMVGRIKGHATTDATMDFQWAQNTSSANNTTVGAGSFIHLLRMA